MYKKISDFRKLVLSAVFGLFFSSICFGQCFFHEQYNIGGNFNEYARKTFQHENNNYLFGGIGYRDTVFRDIIGVYKIQSCGGLDTFYTHVDSTNQSIQDIISYKANVAVVLIQARDNVENGSDSYLFEFDATTMGLRALVNLDQGQNEKSLKLLRRGDSLFVMGYISDPIARTARVYITTYNLMTKQHSTVFYPFNNWVYPNAFHFDRDSNFIITGTDRANGNYGSFILKVDFSMNEQWRRSYFRSARIDSRDFFLYDDSTYALAGNYEIAPYVLKPFFILVDLHGNHVFDTILDLNPGKVEVLEQILVSDQNSLIGVGTHSGPRDTTFYISSMIFKLNMSFDTLWYKTYSKLGDPTEEYPVHLMIDSSENIYVTGYIISKDTMRNEAYLLKVNRDGCLENCDVGIPEESENLFVIYPNPSSGVLRFTSNTQGITNFEIYSLEGRLIKKASFDSNLRLETNQIGKGMFIVRFTNDNQEFKVKRMVIN